MTAPIDRAYVEILPTFKNFNEKVKTEVTDSVATAGKEMDKVNEHVGGNVEKLAKNEEGLFSKLKENAKDLFVTLAPFAAGLGAIEFIKGSAEAAEQAEVLAKQTAAVVKSTGEAANVTTEHVEGLSRSLSEQTGITSDLITNNQNLLLTFTGIRNEVGKGNDIFDQATKVVLDMSTALGEDGKSASIQLGKALNDPIKGITALSRVGVSFTEQQKEAIKTDVERGKTLDAQKIILAELNKEFGGSADAQATAGKKLQAVWHDVEVQVGEVVLPVFEKFSEFMAKDIAPVIVDTVDVIKYFVGYLSGEGSDSIDHFSTGTAKKIETVAEYFQLGFDLAKKAVKEVIDFIHNTAIPVGLDLWKTFGPLLKDGLRIATDAVKNFHVTLKPAGDVIKDVFDFIARNKTTFQGLAVGVLAVVGAIKLWTLATDAWAAVTKIATAVQAAFNVVMDANPIGIVILAIIALVAAFTYLWTHSAAFRDFWIGLWNDIWGFLKAIGAWFAGPFAGFFVAGFNAVTGAFKDAYHWIHQSIDDIVGWFEALPGRISHAASGMWDGIKDAFRGAINWVIGGWDSLKFSIPSFDVFGIHTPGFTLAVPQIPKLDTGGLITKTGLYVGHAGERVVPAEVDRTKRRTSKSTAQAPTLHIEHFHATPTQTPYSIAHELAWALKGRG